MNQYNLDNMTLKEKIGQLICLPVRGKAYQKGDSEHQKIEQAIINDHIGGLILFHGEAISASNLLNDFQNLSNTPLLVSSDIERGVGQILKGGTEFSTNMAFGSTFNPEFAYIQGTITAKEARAVGIHIAYAPVADVNTNPNNPIINTRSYGENPEWIGEFVGHYIRGAQENGMLTTVKHFPGHGSTNEDSHAKLPVLEITKEQFNKVDSIPFQKAIQTGVKLVMTAHIAFPDLTNSRNIPSTLSKEILTHLLREEMSYKGLIVSDALNMTGVRENHTEGEIAILSLEAGVDILLYPISTKTVIDSIVQAVESGRLSEKRIEESVLKILAVKKELGLFNTRNVDIEKIPKILQNKKHQEAALRMARSSITLVSDNKKFVPFSDNNTNIYTTICTSNKKLPLKEYSPIHIVIFDEDHSENIGETFISEIKKRSSTFHKPILASDLSDSLIPKEDTLIIAIFSKIKAWKERSGISKELMNYMNNILKEHSKAIVISFGSPYIYNELYNPNPFICTYSYSDVSQKACAEALFGEIPITGLLPVSLKNHDFLSQIDSNELNRRNLK